MNQNGLLTTGDFAKEANVSIRTVRYYDKEGILKPSHINEAGYRFYSRCDFAKLQKILSLKSLGYSLEEIKNMTAQDKDIDYLKQSLQLQLKLVKQKMEHLQLVEESIIETMKLCNSKEEIDWNRIINLIQVTNLEKNLYSQYRDSRNTNIRIHLHEQYSTNKQGWYQWIFSNLSKISKNNNLRILEIGCGNGWLWKVNENEIPSSWDIHLSDISAGMIHDAKENLKHIPTINYHIFDCHTIPFDNESFDLIIANHMLFYLKDRDRALQEVNRVLKKGGVFIASTYGSNHMKEISQMVKEFNQRIQLSLVNLYEIFGLYNGKTELQKYFNLVEIMEYKDSLIIDKVQPLYDYIESCHGNQEDYLTDKKEEFREYLVKKQKRKGRFVVTKEAGLFYCEK